MGPRGWLMECSKLWGALSFIQASLLDERAGEPVVYSESSIDQLCRLAERSNSTVYFIFYFEIAGYEALLIIRVLSHHYIFIIINQANHFRC